MAEFLIKAKEPWNNDQDTSKMTAEELEYFNARSRKGDIIVVRPDGWKWGNCECLPDFIVVKTNESYEEAKKYEDSITSSKEIVIEGKKEIVQNTVRCKKYSVDVKEVDSVSAEAKDFEKITPVALKVPISTKVVYGDPIKENS